MNILNEKKYLVTYVDEANQLQEIIIIALSEKDAMDQITTFFTINGKKIDRDCITTICLDTEIKSYDEFF